MKNESPTKRGNIKAEVPKFNGQRPLSMREMHNQQDVDMAPHGPFRIKPGARVEDPNVVGASRVVLLPLELYKSVETLAARMNIDALNFITSAIEEKLDAISSIPRYGNKPDELA